MTRSEGDRISYSGYLTFFETEGVAGLWVRRRAALDGVLLHCYSSDNGRDEVVQVGSFEVIRMLMGQKTIDLSRYCNAAVRKVANGKCPSCSLFFVLCQDGSSPAIAYTALPITVTSVA